MHKNYNSTQLLIAGITALAIATFLPGASLINASPLIPDSTLSKQQPDLLVTEIARQVTVRIITEPAYGSGVIIANQGQTYIVLTCQHVVADNQDGRYSVLSADGITHPAHLIANSQLQDFDLALVEFDSTVPYAVAALGNAKALAVGDAVYASGYPNYHLINANAMEDTRDWGTKAFHLTIGKVSLLSKRALPGGYRLGYTNEIELGMSGGPVLNRKGQVVAINGRLKYPLQGIDAFTFADGTKPSEKLFERMEALSWAIPLPFKNKHLSCLAGSVKDLRLVCPSN